MKFNSHHFETMANHCLLVFTEEASPQGSLGGAGFRPSAVRTVFSFSGEVGANFTPANMEVHRSPLEGYPLERFRRASTIVGREFWYLFVSFSGYPVLVGKGHQKGAPPFWGVRFLKSDARRLRRAAGRLTETPAA